MNLNDIEREISNGYITKRIHPQNPDIIILNYTEKAIYDKHWNEVAMSYRGLIINKKTGEVLARPFKKFFNHNEDVPVDLSIPDEKPVATIKHDGSLGILYRLNNQIYWTTRGSFESEQAKIAQDIWEKRYKNVDIPNELTLLVEIIHPNTRVVVNYQNMEDLIVLAAINRFTGQEVKYNELIQMTQKWGMNITQRVNGSLEELIEVSKRLSHNEEGFVLHWENANFRLKIKGKNYLEVHRILHGLSLKQKNFCWKENEIESLIRQVPEEFRKELELLSEKCNNIFDNIKNKVYEFYYSAPKDSRKEFALWVTNNIPKEFISFMFMLFDNKEIDSGIKEYIYKNYSELGID